LWNLIAGETREGDVYHRLLEKLEEERKALDGRVFDILGALFREHRLRDLLIEAIRYGDRPDVKARLDQTVDNLTDRERCRQLLDERALSADSMDTSQVQRIREEMERAEARRLQPHFIESFFLEAFRSLGGSIHEREARRYEVSYVPALIRQRDRLIGTAQPVLNSYERVTFEKALTTVPGKPLASFVSPGHPLLAATLDLILERNRDLLRRGAVLVDSTDPSKEPRALFFLDHAIQDGRTTRDGSRRQISRQMQFVEMRADGSTQSAGWAPYLNYRPMMDTERPAIEALIESQSWLHGNLEESLSTFAISSLVPQHLAEVRGRREQLIDRTKEAVRARLSSEILFWDTRAMQLKDQELAGKANARINSGKARQRAEELASRMQKRLLELEQERQISALPPVVMGGAIVIPAGALLPADGSGDASSAAARLEMELRAMDAVMKAEVSLGHSPRDVKLKKWGYDIESRNGKTGELRFIEVKGRRADAETVTITHTEIKVAANSKDSYILALVLVDGQAHAIHYIPHPFSHQPVFTVESENHSIRRLLQKAGPPR
jgi:hypothetical protein